MKECSDSRSISLLSVVYKDYGRVLIDRITNMMYDAILAVQGDFINMR